MLVSTALARRVVTLQQLSILLRDALGYRMSAKTVSRVLRRQGVSRKRTCKRLCNKAAITEERTAAFCQQFQQARQQPGVVVSIDECYFSERVLPSYGYSRVGQKCVVAAPTGGWTKTSLLLAIASDGSLQYELIKGSVNRALFRAFLESMPYPAGTTLVMDNVAFHAGLQPVTEALGFNVLFTPPYSPQFNPVEMAFSVAKTAYRAAWPWQRGVDLAIDQALERVTASSIRGFFGHVDREVSSAFTA